MPSDWNKPASPREYKPRFKGIPINPTVFKKRGPVRWKTKVLDSPVQRTNWCNAYEVLPNSSHGFDLTYSEWCELEAARLSVVTGYVHEVAKRVVDICETVRNKETKKRERVVVGQEDQCAVFNSGFPVARPEWDDWVAFASAVYGFEQPKLGERLSGTDAGLVRFLRKQTLTFILWRKFDGAREVQS